MLENTPNKVKIVYLKSISIFTAFGRDRNGDFSIWCFFRYCFFNIGLRLYCKYFIYALEILFNTEFKLLKNLFNRNLDKLNIKIFPLQFNTEPDVSKLIFRKEAKPKVSIIIAVYNNLPYTYNCLRALSEHIGEEYTYEVIVINDNSQDKTVSVLSQVGNLIIISNTENKGFVLSCNIGASLAKGEYLCFLNNDTIVQKGWLEALVTLLDNDKTVGITGSKLVFGDGDLQEAGGIVWQDGETTHYGRRGDSKNKKYNFAREVDYCSGASLMISKQDFDLLNGFDERFVPGYFEDTDLCLSMKYKLHKKVIYQPLSVAVHFEGVTSGTSILAGMKQYQQINAVKFRDKWKEELKKQLPHSYMNTKDTIFKYEKSI
jgi:GT2 family glycosyltransferase